MEGLLSTGLPRLVCAAIESNFGIYSIFFPLSHFSEGPVSLLVLSEIAQILLILFQVNVREFEMFSHILPELQSHLDTNCDGESREHDGDDGAELEKASPTSPLGSNFFRFSAKFVEFFAKF